MRGKYNHESMMCHVLFIWHSFVYHHLYFDFGIVNFYFRVSDAGLTAIAENCSLHKLNLCGCMLITDSGLTAIARGSPDLVFLDISVLRVCLITMSLHSVFESCPIFE